MFLDLMQAILDANVTDVYTGKVDIASERGMWTTTPPGEHLSELLCSPDDRGCTVFQSDFHTNDCVVS